MFRTTKEYGDTPEGQRLVSGDALLTVTKVEGTKVTGWFYTGWWDTKVAVSLLRNTECSWSEDDEACECATCLIGDGLTYDTTDSWPNTQELTVEVARYAKPKVGDRLRVNALFAVEEVEGHEDIHGWNERTLERTVSTRSHRHTEWTALIADAWSTGVALYSLTREEVTA